ncbi:MAG: ATP-binding cassette domain-containing protein [Gammaproteobacteria bacterium]|nr:ATP-binding cassette domain-containing protein [Gammaproteobacteria bacterium]MCW8927758.1 ATP-binding cassette domain-containing protein [Gammaproteobacteria bacterium]MCW8959805.1 ATP-binding cassette domain-containing protein [Gammaproteobacteria bacterium]MCW8971866.1 ATP-binding cassette domain-containing protein [Gammaproteobacteria bacterium]MCW8994131.1 ATP-binding cassette domain-containing protein [Gammaproteobacteria bacterium]
MIRFQSLSLRRGTQLLFADASLHINPGQKVGITGANGCGKSSLFALIRNELHADSGELILPPDWVIAHVAQEMPATAEHAIEYVLDGDAELRQLEQQIIEAEKRNDGHLLGELHGRMESIGGYTARARAARLLDGLGFGNEQIELPLREFSGGWRMRLNLAQALMCRSDLLLLDEPTNHLDLDAVIWLQEWLGQYQGTLLLISHDRDFLDEVAGSILHIEQQRLTLYTGNYSAFEQMRAEKLALQQSAYEKQQREIKHIESFVNRFRAKATKAKQAQSRLKSLERMERIAPAHVDSPFHFRFLPPHKLPTPLLTLDRVDMGYGEQPLLRGANLSLQPGDRIGLLGHNGAGKSTLIKHIAGELAPLGGEIIKAQELRTGYFAQHQLEQLDPEASPVQHLQRMDPKASEQSLRDYLGGFGFNNDMALAPVAPFSGGEKARLVLAMLVYQRPNLLLLDEPTNHLDLEMRHAMAMALQEYEGALVVVSHDRHLLRSVTDTLYLVDSGKVGEFDGDLEDYRRWLAEQSRSTPASNDEAKAAHNSAGVRKERKRIEAEQRQRLKPLRQALNRLEKSLDTLQQRKQGLEQQLASPAMYEEQNRDTLKQLLQEKGTLDAELAATEEQWLELGEELEQHSAE